MRRPLPLAAYEALQAADLDAEPSREGMYDVISFSGRLLELSEESAKQIELVLANITNALVSDKRSPRSPLASVLDMVDLNCSVSLAEHPMEFTSENEVWHAANSDHERAIQALEDEIDRMGSSIEAELMLTENKVHESVAKWVKEHEKREAKLREKDKAEIILFQNERSMLMKVRTFL